ncbi:MAG TPA: carbamate kinase [Candidatus Methanofastidiosa archaeon]|nr:carbamate kinase [Candidatus Methanofastidiosa archaeon]
MSRILLALGGNAIFRSDQHGTFNEQYGNINKVSDAIVSLLKNDNQVIITHGNGPQVGMLLIQQDESKDVSPEQPMDVLGAMSQGQIGYMIQLSLMNALRKNGMDHKVVTLVNMVEVDSRDPAFENPTKPVGPFYSKKEARKISLLKGWAIKKVPSEKGEYYRHVVPSPNPMRNIESGVIERLVEDKTIVIASGGGGIPVTLTKEGYGGVEAVIDKDVAGELLAENVGADILMLMTDVEKVMLNYGQDSQKGLDKITVEEAERYMAEGHFPPGTMGPKIHAAINFVKNGGSMAIISSTEKIVDALDGRTGTRVAQ